MGDIAPDPGSYVLKLWKLVGILALLCLYCLPIALLQQWLLWLQTSFIEDYSCRYSSGFTPDSLASWGRCAFRLPIPRAKIKTLIHYFIIYSEII